MNEETTMARAMVPIEIEGVHGYDDNGIVWLKLEDCARGLGLARVQIINGVEYANVRWERVREYLSDEDFCPEVGKRLNGADFKDSYISEPEFYLLAMKVKSEAARAFRRKVATVILPSIRKHGAYMTPEALSKAKADPIYVAELLAKLEQEQERNSKTREELATMRKQMDELQRTNAEYRAWLLEHYDKWDALFAEYKQLHQGIAFLIKELENRRSPYTNSRPIPISEIAAEYGMSGRTLNQILKHYGVQIKINGLWVLSSAYEGQGYTRTEPFADGDGWVLHMYWTAHGREFLRNFLRQHDIYPRS